MMSNLNHPHPHPLIPLFSASHAARWETAETRHRFALAITDVSAALTLTNKSRLDPLAVSGSKKAWEWVPLDSESFASEHPDAMVSAGGHHRYDQIQDDDESDEVDDGDEDASSESLKSDGSVEITTVRHMTESVGKSRLLRSLPSNQTNSHRRSKKDVGSTSHGRRQRKKTSLSKDMAVKTYTWITLWFLITAPVILWDASYCFMRPRSMVGGDLHWIWEPYGLYQEIDYVYGIKALQENNGFTNAQSFLNLIETAMNIAYVYLAHVASCPSAPLIGFAAATMTLSKTVLYWANEYYCGGCSIGHNTWPDLVLYWVIPNGLWLVFPSLIVLQLGKDITNALSVTSKSSTKAASGKKE